MNFTFERLAEASVPAIYLALALVWLWLAAKLPELLRPLTALPLEKVRTLARLGTVFALILAFDAAYWMIANLSRHRFANDSGGLDQFLRTPWLVVSVKSLLLVAAVSFYIFFRRSIRNLVHDTREALVSRFIEYPKDAVCITDSDGVVTHWNSAAHSLFGFSRLDVLGKQLKSFLVPPRFHGEMDQIWEEIRRTHTGRKDHHTLRSTADGKLIPIDVTISPIFEGAQFRGNIGIMREAVFNPRVRYFKESKRPPRPPYAFVIMPFDVSIVRADVWEVAIKDSIRKVGLQPIRGDSEILSEQIMDQVYEDIASASVVIADLTASNPNVFYELGIAHGLDKPVVQLIHQSAAKLPFDIQGIRTIVYDDMDLAGLSQDLKNALLRQLESSNYESDNSTNCAQPSPSSERAPALRASTSR